MTIEPTDPKITPPEPAATEDPPARRSGFGALHYPGFRIYFVGMMLRGVAMWMPLVAIPWLAVESGASAGEVGVITAAFFLPTLFIGALGGVLADRAERRTVLILTQASAAALAVLMFLLVVSGSTALLVLGLVSLGLGALIAVEVPVRQAFMTELVPASEIASAASLHATAWNVTRLFGPVLAGLLIATVGPASPFFVMALISVVVALSIVWMDRYRESGRQRADSSQSIAADLQEGASFALGEPTVRWSLILISATAMFGISTFVTLAPLYALRDLGLGAGGYGAFLGAAGAGAVTAALLVTAFARGDRRPWLISGALAMAVLIAFLAIVQVAAVAFVIAFLLGAAQITLAQNALVSVQSATPDALRGRVMGIWVMVFQGSSLFGAILAGWVAELAGVREALLVSAGALAVIAILSALALRHVTWRLDPTARSAA
jgi:MFS family permease